MNIGLTFRNLLADQWWRNRASDTEKGRLWFDSRLVKPGLEKIEFTLPCFTFSDKRGQCAVSTMCGKQAMSSFTLTGPCSFASRLR